MIRAMFLLLLLATTASAQQKGWEKEWNETLAAAKKEETFADFLLAIKRVNNIVPKTALPAAEPSLFQQDEEKNLSTDCSSMKTAVAPCIERGDFTAAVKAVLLITPAINSFFDKVLVMDRREEIKLNRLSLLREIWETVAPVADFSRFQS